MSVTIKITLFHYSWEQHKLGNHIIISTGDCVTTVQTFDSGYPIISGGKEPMGFFDRYNRNENMVTVARAGTAGYVMFQKTKFYLNDKCFSLENDKSLVPLFLYYFLKSNQRKIEAMKVASSVPTINIQHLKSLSYFGTNLQEQKKIGFLFDLIDSNITLHQREQSRGRMDNMTKQNKKELLSSYFERWINVYKEGAIRKVTMDKYKLSLAWVKKLAPKMRLCDLDRTSYQKLLNDYSKDHERQTTMDFHHHLKAAVLDAVDEGLINKDPTRKVIVKGKNPKEKKNKYLNQFELHMLLKDLKLDSGVNYDWLILLIAKTGMRFSEAIALTPSDFDFSKQVLSINKTWNYKGEGGFQPTKNKSSVRKIQIDWMIVSQFSALIKDMQPDIPIFIKKESIFNSTVNNILERHCKRVGVPVITIHGLRHTHASLLLFAGVSIASVAKRLGHSSMNTTEKTYLHIIQELENKDVDLVMRSLSGLC